MILRKIVIKNFKCFRDFTLEFNDPLTILVGDNETGKSTLLEAINLCMTAQINGKNAFYELSPYWFNKDAKDEYVKKLMDGDKLAPPSIRIELYLSEEPIFATLRGSNNSLRENSAGVMMLVEFDEEFAPEYENYIKEPSKVKQVPIEYYCIHWYSFANDNISKRSIKTNVSFIDTATIRLQSGSDYYLQQIIEDALSAKEKAELSLSYRMLKETFAAEESLSKINTKLKAEKGKISEKVLQVSIDISQKANWAANLTSYLDDIPFQYIGKGDQSILKMLIALDRNIEESHLILIEEPENHLSYSSMNALIEKIQDRCKQKQVILTTHSTFVLNKLGINKVIMFGQNQKTTSLSQLTADTQNYFMKLPGYDTLRLIIAREAILVEGPSDELFVQKAYLLENGKLPIENGIDIISVRSLSFKRFLEIAALLGKRVTAITDNDGDFENNVIQKYTAFLKTENIKICFDKDNSCKTLEFQIVRANELATLNRIFERKEKSKDMMVAYMMENKTECALQLFSTDDELAIPPYISDAFKK